jgi:hypothetical protein
MDVTVADDRGHARVPGHGARRADTEGPRSLIATSAWPRQGGTSGDAPEASAPSAFPSSSKPLVATMMTPAPTVALVSTYPPTVCGLATFTSNLSAAIAAP